MSLVEADRQTESTSAAGPMLLGQLRRPVIAGLLFVGLGLGTSTAREMPANVLFQTAPVLQTTSGAPLTEVRRTGAAIAELRRMSGLTWAQLACLLSVTRRAVHFWASDKPMNFENETRLNELLAFIRTIDRGSAAANRRALLTPLPTGEVPFDLISSGKYDHAVRVLGEGGARAQPHLSPVSSVARAARAPRSPEELMGALHDQIHRDVGRGRPAKSTKVRT
jgi:hypothetical protein